MEDLQIINLYFARDERAIAETDSKYGAFCRSLAENLLSVRQDAEECVNDTYLRAWNAMPPERPARLKSWLGRVVRNLSIDRFRRERAGKRYAGMELLLSELEDCVPDSKTPEQMLEAKALGESISRWLRTLSEPDRTLFLRRYWYGKPLNELAAQAGIPANRLAKRMFGLRQKLKAYLEQEGIEV